MQESYQIGAYSMDAVSGDADQSYRLLRADEVVGQATGAVPAGIFSLLRWRGRNTSIVRAMGCNGARSRAAGGLQLPTVELDFTDPTTFPELEDAIANFSEPFGVDVFYQHPLVSVHTGIAFMRDRSGSVLFFGKYGSGDFVVHRQQDFVSETAKRFQDDWGVEIEQMPDLDS